MNVLRHTDRDYSTRKAELTAAAPLFDPQIEERVRAIIQAIAERRDAALAEFTERFDGVKFEPGQWAVTQAERMTAALTANDTLRKAVAATDRNVAAFARRSRRINWSTRNAQGGCVGEKFDPFQRVGIYIPGGTAPLASTALMTITLARVAGCPQIVVCTPPRKDRTVNSALLYAATVAGATEIYKVGGAQAIAALALGTESIARVQKIFGPGNAYVVAAKRMLVGHVAIDLLPGPSEVLILADDSANPQFVAADLLAQAEHGSGHERVWLITPSARLLRAVEGEIKRQLPWLSRRALIETALQNNGWLIQVRNLEEGIELTNALAPEHLELHVRQGGRVAEKIYTAGAIFIGPWSPTVLGDYVAGPSHTLPTGGAGASFPGLTVDMFQRRTSVVTYDRASLKRSLPIVEAFAHLEGLDAHGQSAAIRFRK